MVNLASAHHSVYIICILDATPMHRGRHSETQTHLYYCNTLSSQIGEMRKAELDCRQKIACSKNSLQCIHV